MEVNRFLIAIIILCLFAVISTFIIGKLAGKRKVYKYIPCMLSAAGGIASYIKAAYFSQSFQDIAYMLLAMALGITFAVSLITAVVADFIRNRNS